MSQLQAQLAYCKTCQNRKFDMNTGIVCGLTDQKPQFEDKCADYNIDEAEVKLQLEKQEIQQREEQGGSSYAQAAEQRSPAANILIGMLMIIGAVVWLFLGLQADRIFFYPFALIIGGIITIFKGIVR